MNRNKQKTHPNSLKESIFGNFSENLGLIRNRSVCFGCFDIGSKHRNKPNFFIFGFTKQTETNAKQILFRFVSVRTAIYFCLFRGHPRSVGWTNAPVLVTLLSEAVLVTLLGEASEMEILQSLFRELRVNFVWSKDLNSNS